MAKLKWKSNKKEGVYSANGKITRYMIFEDKNKDQIWLSITRVMCDSIDKAKQVAQLIEEG